VRKPRSLIHDHDAQWSGGSGKVKRNNSKEVKEPLDNLSRIAYKAKGWKFPFLRRFLTIAMTWADPVVASRLHACGNGNKLLSSKGWSHANTPPESAQAWARALAHFDSALPRERRLRSGNFTSFRQGVHGPSDSPECKFDGR
jgi:hypothetical protein